MIADRRVKIIATIGPASMDEDRLKDLFKVGVNVFRLNFSHGKYKDHLRVIERARKISKELKAPIALLQDLQGPKIRIGSLENGQIKLKPKNKIVITDDLKLGTDKEFSTDYPYLSKICTLGTRILLDDGLIELCVIDVEDKRIQCEVIFGGVLRERKGVNIPGVELGLESLTKKDLKDLDFGLEHNVDYIALSFVRFSKDVQSLKKLIKEKQSKIQVIAKIELKQALEDLENIIRVSDGVMVARGDLAVEVGQSCLAGVQKDIIKMANDIGRPVITATQMLNSMIRNPRPTRAEVTDIANAVLDGSDALMLSEETALGKYPAKCVEVMDDIVQEVERQGVLFYKDKINHKYETIAEAIAASAVLTAKTLDAEAIVCLTTSGRTAKLISSIRPKAKIITVTHLIETLNRMELVWGVKTFSIDPYDSTDIAIDQIETQLVDLNIVKPGDKVVLTMGVPIMKRGTTNSIKVLIISKKGRLLEQDKRPLRWR